MTALRSALALLPADPTVAPSFVARGAGMRGIDGSGIGIAR